MRCTKRSYYFSQRIPREKFSPVREKKIAQRTNSGHSETRENEREKDREKFEQNKLLFVMPVVLLPLS